MSRKKISTTIYVTAEQSERLKVLHERTKVPVAVYIREGIDLVLKHYQHVLPGQLPLVDDAPPRRPREPADDEPVRETPRGRSDRSSPHMSADAAGKK